MLSEYQQLKGQDDLDPKGDSAPESTDVKADDKADAKADVKADDKVSQTDTPATENGDKIVEQPKRSRHARS